MKADLTQSQAALLAALTRLAQSVPAHLRRPLADDFILLLGYEGLSIQDHAYLLGKRPKARSPVTPDNVFWDARRFHIYFAERQTEIAAPLTEAMASLNEIAKASGRKPASVRQWMYTDSHRCLDGATWAPHSLIPGGGIIKYFADPDEDWEVTSQSQPTMADAITVLLSRVRPIGHRRP